MNALEVTELHTGKRGKRHFVLCAHLHAEEQTGRPAVLRAMCHRAGHALALNSREHRQSHLVVMDQLLLYHLHGIDLVVLLQPYQQDLGVAPAPDDPDQVEVLQPEPLRYLDPVHPVDDWLEVLIGVDKMGGSGRGLITHGLPTQEQTPRAPDGSSRDPGAITSQVAPL